MSLSRSPFAAMAESVTTISDLDHDALVHVFSQLLDDPAGLALVSRCACVSKSWREVAYDPLLYVRLTNWAKVEREVEEEMDLNRRTESWANAISE